MILGPSLMTALQLVLVIYKEPLNLMAEPESKVHFICSDNTANLCKGVSFLDYLYLQYPSCYAFKN